MKFWIIITVTALCIISPAHCFFSILPNIFGLEFCDDNYISPDFVKLKTTLKDKLFGQNIVINQLVPVLEAHFNFEPKKALVICMHGWTGSGKNYAANIIAKAIYKKKLDSAFVKIYNGRLHFPLDSENHVEQYKINIQNWIKGNVTNCPRSLFVFDEVDKIPMGVIDAVKPFFDYHEKIDSVDFRKSIFIFISNTGAEVINSRYMELWKRGRFREDMKYKDFEPYLRKALYEGTGGFKKSSVLEGHLVSLYLPFLPLGEEQVRQCIVAEMNRQKFYPVTEETISLVLDELEFNEDRLSTSGCKRVVDFVANLRYKRMFEEL